MTNTPQTPDERAELYLDLFKRGLTYRQVAEEMGAVSGEAVRNAIRRYNEKRYGVYSSAVNEEGDGPALSPQQRSNAPFKILTLDIETAPGTAWYFSPKTRYIPMDFMLDDGRILCFAAKWLDGGMMFSSEWEHGRQNMLQLLWNLLDEADAVITYNGDNFDIPWCNSEFQKLGLGRYRPFKSIDLIKPVRKHFRFMYNKLDFLSMQLLGERKVENGGIQLWKDLLIEDKAEAKDMFRVYNKQDVALTEKLYLDLRPWLDGHPAVNYETDGITCRTCGSEDLEQVGWKVAVMMRYPMYRCAECHSLSRTTQGGERITNTYGV